MMPDLDGYEITRRMKRDKVTKEIPVIIVSASGGKEITRKIKEAGGDDHIIKPFDHEEILNLISGSLKKESGDDGEAATDPGQQDGGQDDTSG